MNNSIRKNGAERWCRDSVRLELDGLLVTHPADWFYLTGFTGDSGALVVSQRAATLITDGRFVGQAKAETPA